MKKIFLIGFSMLSLMASAQEGWTLRECIDYAIDHNIDVRRIANTAEQNAVDVSTAKWSRLPNLNGGVNQGWNWGRTASPADNGGFTDVNNTNTSFALSASVPLFTGLQIPNQYAYAKLNFKAAIEDLNKAKEDVAIQVASSYLQVLLNLELSKVAEAQIELSKSQYDRLLKLEEVGKAAAAEVAEAKARMAQDEMNAVQAQNNYQLSLLDLSQLLELSTPEGFSVSAEDLPPFHELSAPEEVFQDALMNKPEVKAAIFRVEGSQRNIRLAQSQYYPQLSFSADLSTNYYTMSGLDTESFGSQMKNNLNKYVGFNLSIPLFNRLTTRNRVRAARLQRDNFNLQLDNTKKNLYKEIQQAWYNAVAAESKYKSSEVAVEANELAFKLIGEKFDNGQSTLLAYDEAKQNLMRAESDRIQAKYEYMFRLKILDFYKGIPLA